MQLRFYNLLDKLAQFSKSDTLGLEDVSTATGISLRELSKILSNPRARVKIDDIDAIIEFLVKRFRPYIEDGVSDDKLKNQLRFSLLEFEFKASSGCSLCQIRPTGKHKLNELTCE